MWIVYWMEKCPVVGEYLEHMKFDSYQGARVFARLKKGRIEKRLAFQERNRIINMTVAELITELLKVEDITKEIYTFRDHTMHSVLEVDELSDRVDLNLGDKQ